ncbi:methyltransferase [Streptomyces sp. NPDC051909]|uniref:methyltransferase n=1 Tax=Streptomyces sp. NPDC051909 TaxID=3154944 RepID=UPI00342241D8
MYERDENQAWRPRVDDCLVNELLMSSLTLPAVLVAHELRIFRLLSERSLAFEEISQRVPVDGRPLKAILQLCASKGLLSVEDGRYALTLTGEEYFVEGRPSSYTDYLGMLKETSALLAFEPLMKAVETNSPQAYGGEDIFEAHEAQAEKARLFTRTMHGHSAAPASAWPDHVDMSLHRRMLDIGGGSSAHAIGAVRRWPHLRATVLDLATVCEVANEYIERAGVQDHVGTLAFDMWQDALPAADIHFYSEIFHDWSPEQCRSLVRKSFESLEHEGRLIIHEMLYDEEKQFPDVAAAYSVGMLLWTQGQQFTAPELTALLAGEGFVDIEVKPTFGYWSIVTGRKP